jgi:hypothetical protein
MLWGFTLMAMSPAQTCASLRSTAGQILPRPFAPTTVLFVGHVLLLKERSRPASSASL